MGKVSPKITSHQATIDNIKIGYTIAGSGNPLVLIRGDKYFWESFIKDFGKNARVKLIAFSPPGYDQLKTATSINTLEKFCDSCDKLFAELGLNHFSLSGLSLGSIVAFLYATYHPEKVSKLLLLAPPFSILGNRKAKLMKNLLTLTVKHEPLSYISSRLHKSRFINYWAVRTSGFYHFNQEIFANVILPAARDCNERLANQQAISMLEINPFPLFEKITAETAIIIGDHDPVISVADAQKISHLIKNCQLFIIPQAKHAIMLERPKELSQIITNFLKS